MVNEVSGPANERRGLLFHPFILKQVLSIGAIIILITIAFQAIVPAVSAAEDLRIFYYGADEVLDSANPYLGILEISYVFYSMIWDTMTARDMDLITVPNLANSWWAMDGATASSLSEPTDFSNTIVFPQNNSPADWAYGSVWEYNLTEYIFWNDGTPFTAEDVAFTINMQIRENFNIYWAYQPTTVWIHHCEVVNDLKVRIFYADTQNTNWPFPISFGNEVGLYIMPKHYFKNFPSVHLAFDFDGIPAIGTGPLMGTAKLRQEVIAGEFVTLVKNPYYDFIDPADGIRKGLGAAYNRTIEVDKLIMKMFSDMNTLHLAVETGQVDAAIILPGTYLQWLSRQENGTLPSEITLVRMYPCRGFTKPIGFNTYGDAPGTLNALRLDPAVHRAAAIATNKSFIIKSVYSNMGEPGTGIIATPAWPDWYWEPGNETSWFNLTDGNGVIIPAGSYSKPMKDVMEFDLDLANDILDAAGYVWTGEEGNSVREAGPLVGERMQHLFGLTPAAIVGETLEFEMVIAMTASDDRRTGLYITDEWMNIGIDAWPLYVDDPTWDQLVYSYTFNIMFTYWSGDVDPNYLCYITTTMSLGGWNEFGTNDPVYDQLFYNQAKAQNYTERKYWVDECSKYQYLSGSIITFVYPEICYAYRNDTWTNWGNWTEHVGLGIDFFWCQIPFLYTIKYNPSQPDSGPDAIIIAAIIAAALIAAVSITIITRKKKKIEQLKMDEEEESEEEVS